jgi:hypothetical protein
MTGSDLWLRYAVFWATPLSGVAPFQQNVVERVSIWSNLEHSGPTEGKTGYGNNLQRPHRPLKELLSMAGKGEDATLLTPDLQRPYIWDPSQVVVLVDSLIRGWPFGTLLTWKVKTDDPARALARSFWKTVDRTNPTKDGEGQLISAKHPPAKFHMVLDGQQRLQSLLLAFGGDGWGFKLLDREWHEYLSGTKARGPRGQLHWSLGCLCVDIPALAEAYGKAKRATAIDYNKEVLRWVVTDNATGQSKLRKPLTYVEPLQIASASAGRFVRLSRLWEAAPEQAGIDAFEAVDLASSLLQKHGVSEEHREHQARATGALLMALKDVKQTRVTYLELAEYEEALGSREVYNDAVVNIFTRLNTAGRTLTREDITFAWLKVGWNTACKCLSWPTAGWTPGVFMNYGTNSFAVALNQDGSVNSATNPAAPGSIVAVFANGLGSITPEQADGALINLPLPNNVFPATVQALVPDPNFPRRDRNNRGRCRGHILRSCPVSRSRSQPNQFQIKHEYRRDISCRGGWRIQSGLQNIRHPRVRASNRV